MILLVLSSEGIVHLCISFNNICLVLAKTDHRYLCILLYTRFTEVYANHFLGFSMMQGSESPEEAARVCALDDYQGWSIRVVTISVPDEALVGSTRVPPYYQL